MKHILLSILFSFAIAQNIQWTGLEGGWIELISTEFERSDDASFLTASGGIDSFVCGIEGQVISPKSAGVPLVWAKTGIPAFNQVLIIARYGFIDSWDNEEGYIRVNGVSVWSEKTTYTTHTGTSYCGVTGWADKFVTVEREVSVPTGTRSLNVQIGANLNEAVSNERFGISSLVIYVRADAAGAPAFVNGSPPPPVPVIPSIPPPQWRVVEDTNFRTIATGANSNWLDNNRRQLAVSTCGTEGKMIRVADRGYMQWERTGLTAFSKVRFTIRIGFLDSWDGESAYININNSPVWQQTSMYTAQHSTNVCGHSQFKDRFETVTREVSVAANTRTLSIRVGCTLDQDVGDEALVITSFKVEIQ